jgi:hypothetical protein
MGNQYMRLTIIEPHEHFGVLMRWIQVCVRTSWKVQIITSKSNWEQLKEGIPETCHQCHFYEILNIPPFPKTDFLIFTSMQTKWWRWIHSARKYPSALLIHNGNTYFRPFQNLAKKGTTDFTLMKYSIKWLYEQLFSYPVRRHFLEANDYIVPFSSTQIDFLRENSQQEISAISPKFKQRDSSVKKPVVLLYIYNRLPIIDGQYLKKCLLEYKSNEYSQIIVISTEAEYQQLQMYFHEDQHAVHMPYPLSLSSYLKLLRESKYVCLPFQQERMFNIFKEIIGTTKYSGRIRDAIEFGCELHMPDYIPSESSEDLPTLKQASVEMELKLNEMYYRANGKYE